MSGPPALAAALRCRREGHALPREFHLDESIYEYELDAIWRRSWLLAGRSAQAAEPGEFFRFDVAAYSVVVVRDEAGTLHALHNTCRHRGMPVCLEPAGVVKRWVCPYHRWSYGLDGRLLGCDGIEDVIDVDEYGLHRIAVAEVGRLVFVWLSGSASRFEDAGRELGAALCTAGARAGEGCPPDRLRRPCELEAGLAGLYRSPREDRWWAAKRTPLAPGFVTESLDGAPVTPLMGDYPDYDVGTLRVRTVPSFWMHASADHAVVTRLTPAGPHRTMIRVQWLVEPRCRRGPRLPTSDGWCPSGG